MKIELCKKDIFINYTANDFYFFTENRICLLVSSDIMHCLLEQQRCLKDTACYIYSEAMSTNFNIYIQE